MHDYTVLYVIIRTAIVLNYHNQTIFSFGRTKSNRAKMLNFQPCNLFHEAHTAYV